MFFKKIRGSKCIYPETSGTLPMFGVFFILISILSTPPLIKKSEAIDLEL